MRVMYVCIATGETYLKLSKQMFMDPQLNNISLLIMLSPLMTSIFGGMMLAASYTLI